jgi:hypothetical protein
MGHSRFLGGIAAGLVSCVCAGGCSPGDRPPQSLSRDAAIAQLSASGNAMYSFRLTGPYPGGAYGHFVIVTSAPAVACGRYAGPDVTDDYWFVDIELGDVVKGVYVAATNSVTGTKSMAANVSILHRTSGTYAANFPATSGTVTLAADLASSGTSSPDVDIDIRFPTEALQQLGCEGWTAKDGSRGVTSCECVSAAGTMSTCVPDSGLDDYCCTGEGDHPISFVTHFAAVPCSAMCRVTAGSPDYCSSLPP